MTSRVVTGIAGAGLITCLALASGMRAQQAAGGAVQIDNDDIGGVVTSTKGPEAGVWVIAETRELPTGFNRSVVTDDRGRYVLPDLPNATYDVWVRGYGLVDSPRVKSAPGQILNLTAVVAPDARAAAEYYPANYWFSLVELPPKSDFPGTGLAGNGISRNVKSQAEWISRMKVCIVCHQMGNKYIREIPESIGRMPSEQAWGHRTNSGQFGAGMTRMIAGLGRDRYIKMLADWTDRIAAGEVPPQPPRPQGVERNLVVSMWDWSDQYSFVHDSASTDKRDPTVNPYGPVYASGRLKPPDLVVVYPRENRQEGLTAPMRDPNVRWKDNYPAEWKGLNNPRANQGMGNPSPAWGTEMIWKGIVLGHNPMLDHKARVWQTQAVQSPEEDRSFCNAGSDHPSAQYFPLDITKNPEPYMGAYRHLAVWDPQTREWTLINTCAGSHSLQFAHDANHTLWVSNQGQVLGWLNTKLFDETGDEQKAQGWTPYILDTNGNGKVDEWVGPDDPIDPTKDQRIRGGSYGIAVNPLDGSIWTATGGTGSNPIGTESAIIRVSPGSNPPYTTLSERYEAPMLAGWPRGLDLDRKTGVIWTALAGSGHIASFDRRKCKVLNGPTATGKHCPEGWTLYQTPGPKFKGNEDITYTADMHYRHWVDQFNTLGLGENVPIANGTDSDSLIALLPDTGKFVMLRVPYPLGFFSRSMDGRIDDPQAGWKGRGLWANYGQHTPWHLEGGKGQTSKAVHFQLRPDPLAK